MVSFPNPAAHFPTSPLEPHVLQISVFLLDAAEINP